MTAGRRWRRGFLRGRALAATVLLGLPVLALAGWWAVYIWPTERKAIEACTRQLVAATAPLSLERFEASLAPQASFAGPEGQRWLDRSQMLAALQSAVGNHSVARQHVSIQDVQLRGPQFALVLIDVATTFANQPWGDRPILTRWLLEWWRPDPRTPWRLSRAQWQRHPSPFAVQPAYGIWSQ